MGGTRRLWATCVAFSVMSALGCGGGSGDDDDNGGGDGGAGDGGGSPDAGPAQVLKILPRDITIEIIDGAIVTQDFTATINGSTDVTDSVTWSYDAPQVGTLPSPGAFVPTGTRAGVGNLKATFGSLEDSTTVAVRIVKTVDPGGLSGSFGVSVGADPSLNLLYPYDDTVFPLNVASQEMQWNGGAAGDAYKLRITEQYYDYTIYFNADPPSRHLIDQAEWASITESGQGAQSDPVQVSLQRSSGGNTYDPVPHTWHVAQIRLPGRIYYWELPGTCGTGNGKILSLKPSDATAEEFFTTTECWGCHTVSRDGRQMAASFDTTFPFPFQTIDLSVAPSVLGPITQATGLTGTFSAFNHDGTRLLMSNDPSAASSSVLKIADTATGAVLNADVMGAGCGEPAWSPDGTMIAATCGYPSGGWTFDQSTADLIVAPVNPDGISVGAGAVVVPQAGGTGRPAYPSFSPDNQWLVYGRPTSGSRSTGNGTLWMAKVDGSDARQLAIASSDNRSFNPTFAPIRGGGYYWVAFMSRRDYGNRLVSQNRQQLWLTAIEDPPTAAPDPSNPPFYLRGQQDCGLSENAYFAPDPCIEEENQPCESGIDCCNGHCIYDETLGEAVCGEPGTCSEDGNACEVDGDCCNATSTCQDGWCTPPVIP